MTPASLRMNYVEELKKCGDSLYKKNQFWEFIHADGKPELMNTLSNILSLSIDFIKKQLFKHKPALIKAHIWALIAAVTIVLQPLFIPLLMLCHFAV